MVKNVRKFGVELHLAKLTKLAHGHGFENTEVEINRARSDVPAGIAEIKRCSWNKTGLLKPAADRRRVLMLPLPIRSARELPVLAVLNPVSE